MKLKFLIVFAVFVFLSSFDVMAEFALRNIYSDNMVLQRDVPIKIYGYAAVGEKITGEFAGQKVETIVGKSGEFVLIFPKMPADGKAYTLKITDSRNHEIKLKNILIGEVYFASGQSNMEMPLWSNQAFWRSFKGDEEAAKADLPQIRFVKVARKVLHGEEADRVEKDAIWEVISPETAASYSATAYYFAKTLHQKLKVPVGIIQCPWSGTLIEPWISKDAFFAADDKIAIEEFVNYDLSKEEREVSYLKSVKIWAAKFHNSNLEATKKSADWKNFDFDDRNWDVVNLPGLIANQPDINWVRKTVEIPDEMVGKDLILNLGPIDDCDDTYFNGVKVGSIEITHNEYWQTLRVYKIPAELVKKGKNVIASRVYNYLGAGGFNGHSSLMKITTADKLNSIDLSGEWRIKQEFVADMAKIGSRPQPLNDAQLRWNSTLYNGMVNPWTVYPIRGVIWYQGCANSGAYVRYMKLFPMLINNWRDRWNNPQMPFIFVQLSAFRKHVPDQRVDENAWMQVKPLYASADGFSYIREVQEATLRVPFTGMAVSMDRGDQYDIHPANKAEIGERLAMEAMRLSFGAKGITASPYYKSMKIEGDKIRLSFINADNGFTFDGNKINGFAIGDDAGNWQVAEVKIVNGNDLIVSSPLIKKPTKVRYAFCAFADNLNLYNKEGFPVCPFRTDKPDYLLK
ncbi:MAG: hypothetical protein IJW31_04140 [Lentisphaeria bacterium]|nr:hypothetical protein [Lentisphaeria bacterium]